MVAVNISINQLIDVIKSLDEVDQVKVRDALNTHFELSDEAREELLRRKQAFTEGRMASTSWDLIKAKYESL